MDVRRYRLLLKALVFCVLSHLLALAFTAAMMMPGLDMGADVASRATFILEHPWTWRAGWFFWALSAIGNVSFSVALTLALGGGSRRGFAWAVSALILALFAAVPDLAGNAGMVFGLPEIANAPSLDPTSYIRVESSSLWRVGTVAAGLYTLMGVGWLLAATGRNGGVWRHQAAVSFGMLAATIFVFSAIANGRAVIAAAEIGTYEGYELGAAANALAFPIWLVTAVWIGLVMADDHHKAKPSVDQESRRVRWSSGGPVGRLFTGISNSKGLRDLVRAAMGHLSVVQLRSDTTDVVFLNWCVPTHRVQERLPPTLSLDQRGGRTIVTVLTYKHGHFGPSFIGPLRRLVGVSPLQSNWRLYLSPQTAKDNAVYFMTSCADLKIMVPISRVLSDALPLHFVEKFRHGAIDGRWTTEIDPGEGSGPDLRSTVCAQDDRVLPSDFESFFDDWSEAVKYIVNQHRVLSDHPAFDAVHEARIHIPIDTDKIVPALAQGRVESAWLAEMTSGCQSLAFVVPGTEFNALSEGWLDARGGPSLVEEGAESQQ